MKPPRRKYTSEAPSAVAQRLPAACGAKSAQELVEQLKDEYLIMGGLMVVKKGGGISISFDACGHWVKIFIQCER